jgi:hypothetical protein
VADPTDTVRLALSREQYAELVGNVLAVRQVARELVEVFEASANDAAAGAGEMVAALDHALDILGYVGDR